MPRVLECCRVGCARREVRPSQSRQREPRPVPKDSDRQASSASRCDPPRSLVQGELLLQQETHPFDRAGVAGYAQACGVPLWLLKALQGPWATFVGQVGRHTQLSPGFRSGIPSAAVS